MAVINTSAPGYIAAVQALTDTYDQFKDTYGPVVKRMNGDQLRQLRQRDPMFAKFVQISQEISALAEKVGIET